VQGRMGPPSRNGRLPPRAGHPRQGSVRTLPRRSNDARGGPHPAAAAASPNAGAVAKWRRRRGQSILVSPRDRCRVGSTAPCTPLRAHTVRVSRTQRVVGRSRLHPTGPQLPTGHSRADANSYRRRSNDMDK